MKTPKNYEEKPQWSNGGPSTITLNFQTSEELGQELSSVCPWMDVACSWVSGQRSEGLGGGRISLPGGDCYGLRSEDLLSVRTLAGAAHLLILAPI